jgi:hypothetical protein
MSLNRVVASTLVAAAAVGIPGSALAIGSAAPGSKSAPGLAAPGSKSSRPPMATDPAAKPAGLSELSALAASAGITESRLQSGLIAAKQAGGGNAAGVAAFARSTGVPVATAQRIVHSVFGPNMVPNLSSPSVAAALATRLGVSTAAAQQALNQIRASIGPHGLDPSSAAFTAIAHHLGVSPSQFAIALKESLRSAAGE